MRSWDRVSAGGLPPGFPQVSWWVRAFSSEANYWLVRGLLYAGVATVFPVGFEVICRDLTLKMPSGGVVV